MINIDFYKNRRVLVTGHSGFKGSWLCRILKKLGARVCGLSLMPESDSSLFFLADVPHCIEHAAYSDIRIYDNVEKVFDQFHPEIVIHLAAQPLVRESYRNPRMTYETNVLGTLHILECIRHFPEVRSFLNVTTEKVYENKENAQIRIDESFPLNGFDPYSNSKSCSELITETYMRCFFDNRDCAISTARTSNVLGGGDFATDRIIPDCVRAAIAHKDIIVRNPQSCRPYQFILDPLFAYLEICEKQYDNKSMQGCFNITPDDAVNTADLVSLFCRKWGENLQWVAHSNHENMHEADFLVVSNEKFKERYHWKSAYSIETAVENVVQWTKAWLKNPALSKDVMDLQIEDFIENRRGA